MADDKESKKTNSLLRKQMRNPIFWIVFVLFLYMFIGFIVVPFVVKGQIVEFIEVEFKRKASIESVSFNPFTFSSSIRGFLLNEDDDRIFLKWGEFYTNLNIFPLIAKEISIEEMRVWHPEVTIIKRRNDFNFSSLIPEVKAEEAAVDSLVEEAEWDIVIKSLEIQNLNIIFNDKSLESTAEIHIDSINVLVQNLRPFTSDTTNYNISFKIREGGFGSANGFFRQLPLFAELNLNVDSVSIVPAQTYLSQFAYLRIDGGEAKTKGKVNFEWNVGEEPRASFTGTMGLHNLNLFDTQREERFLSWNRIDNYGVEINSAPVSLSMDSILVDGLYSRIAIEKDQTINVFDAFEPTLKKIDTTNTKENPSLDYKFDIGTISISSSEMYFSDFSLPINFAARVHSLNGNIEGVATGNPLGAMIAMEGTVDEYGFTKIEGNVDPFEPLKYTNITMNFHNIDLTKMDGYSGKFVGYEIDKGAINLDLEYLIKNGFLTSTNQIFLNQLTLGDEVESEESMGPIIKLAIALLKDSEGNIDLDVEVEGDLNDPDISTGKLVWWAVKRSLTTIVTAPFRFLGNLLGISNSEDLEFVDFEVADTSLAPHQIEKLINVTKALNERPGLKLGIYGAVDTVADKYALQKIKFDSLFTEKLKKESGKEKITTASADQGLRREILETMYVELYSDSLLNILISRHIENGDEATRISADNIENSDIVDIREYFSELKEQLITKQTISNEEFLSLTHHRAENIWDFLVYEQKLPRERVILKGNEIYDYEDDDWVRCRLELEPM